MNLILSTKKTLGLPRPLWVEVSISESYINHIEYLSSSSCFGSTEEVVVHADGWWHPRLGFSDCKLQAIVNQKKVRFRLIRDENRKQIVTSGIYIKTLAQLNETYGTAEKFFFSKDVPVLMAIYYSTKRLGIFK